MQIAYKICTQFCLELTPCSHGILSHFRKINWPSVEGRVELCTSTLVFRFWNGIASSYLNGMFISSLNNCSTRSQILLDKQLCRTNEGEKSLSFLGRKIWNKSNSTVKEATLAAFLTHDFEKEIQEQLQYFIDLADLSPFSISTSFSSTYVQGNHNGNNTCFGYFLDHYCHIQSASSF